MFINARPEIRHRHSGVSLVEVVIFIVVVSVGIVGLLATMNTTVKYSADPMLRKQAIAIAESLLEEIQLHPFTYCDPDDAANLTDPPPTSAANCTGGPGGTNNQSLVFGSGEARGSTTASFDNVADYSGFTMVGIRSIDAPATVITGLEKYTAEVAISQAGTVFGIASDETLLIAVKVTDPNGTVITISGYRFRYAPVATS